MKNKKDEFVSENDLTKSKLIDIVKKQKGIIKSLQADGEKYQSLFNNSIDGIYKSTPAGKWCSASAAARSMSMPPGSATAACCSP